MLTPLPVLVNIGMSSVFLLLTLAYVISVQRATKGATEIRLSKTYDGVIEFCPRSLLEKGEMQLKRGLGMFGLSQDSWIVVRIFLAFVMVE